MYKVNDNLEVLISPDKLKVIVINKSNNSWIKMFKDDWTTIGRLVVENKVEHINNDIFQLMLNYGIVLESSASNTFYDKNQYNILYNITDLCNLSCSYCYVNNSNENKKSYCFETDYKKILNIIKECNFSGITISGGEPLLHPDIYDIIMECRKITRNIGINTNATVNVGNLIRIAPLVKSISISLDSGIPEENDVLRGDGNYLKTINAIKRLIALGHRDKLIIHPTITKKNRDNITSIFDVSKRYGIKVDFNYLFRCDDCNMSLNTDEENDTRLNILKWNLINHYPKYDDTYYLGEIYYARQRCPAGSMLLVAPNGDMYPCPSLYDEKNYLGNILSLGKESLQQYLDENKILCGYRNKSIYNNPRYEKCNNCSVKNFCAGLCYGMDMTELKCEYYRKYLNFKLWDYDSSLNTNEQVANFESYFKR